MHFHNNHLSYCTNIHSYTNSSELIATLSGPVADIASAFGSKPFAVGLHLNGATVNELSEEPSKLQLLQDTLKNHNFYVCSLNCFPHGTFHGERVKENVYQPDWGSEIRAEYTIRAATILSALLPDGIDGSISTVPVTYGKNLPATALTNIADVCSHLQKLPRRIFLAFEPEPDCYLDCVSDCLKFFKLLKDKLPSELYEYTGICFDTCHFAVIFAPPATALQQLIDAKINVPKIQISTALKTRDPELLQEFNESVYLHQTAIKQSSGLITRLSDLDKALDFYRENPHKNSEWRVHFHVPVFCSVLRDNLETTADELTPVLKMVNKMQGVHLEVETYSFNVIPGNKESITDSIINELQYVIKEQ